jgi:hypothetical protein
MGSSNQILDLRLLKVRLCADDLSFAQMAAEARRKAVAILGPFQEPFHFHGLFVMPTLAASSGSMRKSVSLA